MTQTITIETSHAQRDVLAIVQGDLALHRSYYPTGEPSPAYPWTITHVCTGWALCWTKRCDQARHALRELHALGGWEFDFTNARTEPEQQRVMVTRPQDWQCALIAIFQRCIQE